MNAKHAKPSTTSQPAPHPRVLVSQLVQGRRTWTPSGVLVLNAIEHGSAKILSVTVPGPSTTSEVQSLISWLRSRANLKKDPHR